MANEIDSIKRRRAEIAQQLAALRAEDQDLAIAERVLLRFAQSPASPNQHPPKVAATGAIGTVIMHATAGNGKSKPLGTPTMPEMIIEALASDPTAKRKGGLEPSKIAGVIAKRWWAGVPTEAVGPIAWRMWKRHELEKAGRLYSLPKQNGPNDA